jgi:hypothetical protein
MFNAVGLRSTAPPGRGVLAKRAPGVEPVFLEQEQAIDYATGRACFRSGEIRVVDASGAVERVIPFNDADRKL